MAFSSAIASRFGCKWSTGRSNSGDAAGADKDIAINKIHKLVLTSTVVEVVNNEGSVLLSVPVSDSVRVELTDSESSATLEQQTIDLAEFGFFNQRILGKTI